MPSKLQYKLNKLQNTIAETQNNLLAVENVIKDLNIYNVALEAKLNRIASKGLYQRKYGLENLIEGQAPTFTGWDTNPTDGSNITDNNPATACTTGTSDMAAYAPVYIEWDLKGTYQVLVTGLGRIIASAGTARWYINLYADGAWRAPSELAGYGTSDAPLVSFGGIAEKVRLRCLSTDIATLTPYIRDLSVWRLD